MKKPGVRFLVGLVLAVIGADLRAVSAFAETPSTPVPETGDGNGLLQQRAGRLVRDHLDFWQSRQFHGGWPQAFRLTDGAAFDGAGKPGDQTVILQHEATPRLAMLFLLAHETLGDPSYLETARRSGDLILELQAAHGGWAEEFHREAGAWKIISPKNHHGEGILDDGTSQNCVILLCWLHRLTQDRRYESGARKGFEFLLKAQHARGSWPQAFPGEKTNLSGAAAVFSVLNDGATTFSAELLLWRALRDPSFVAGRDAFLRCTDWLITVQTASKIPAWGLQYDREDFLTWARPWEPPAISPSASRDAMQMLLTAHELTGEKRYLAAVAKALEWFDSSKRDGGWVLFYDPTRGVPIRAAEGKITDGVMERTGYVSGKPSDWGLTGVRARYQRRKSGLATKTDRRGGETTKAGEFLTSISGQKSPDGPFFVVSDKGRFTHTKDRSPWLILDLIEGLHGHLPPLNILLRVAPAPSFPDVLHNEGR